MQAAPQAGGLRPLLELGRGGMARVYLAEKVSRGLHKLVVLKVLEPALAASEEMRSAFQREAQLCARLNHPNIVQVYEVHDETSLPLMIMEYVEGITLSQALTLSEGRLPLRLHVHVIAQMLAGLHYFHEHTGTTEGEQEPVHRDVSPQNVLVMHEGAVKVLDFGIAKLQTKGKEDVTEAGVIKGKLAYMPAEQLSGDGPIDRRADVFAAGVMLWEAFAGRRLWQSWSQQDQVRALVEGKLPSIREACPTISEQWEAIIGKALANARDARFPTALDMQATMESAMSELGGPVPQRELATFMKSEFGAARSERQKAIEAEIAKAPSESLISLNLERHRDLVTPTPGARSGIELVPEHDATRVENSRNRSTLPWLLLLGVGVLLVGWQGLRLTETKQASQPLATTAARGLTPPVSASPPLSAVPVPTPTPSVVAAPEAPDDSAPLTGPKDAHKSRVRVGGRSVARPAASVATPATAAAPAPNCNPPYVVNGKGVKVYKPECLQ